MLKFDVAAVESGIQRTQFAKKVEHFRVLNSTNAEALEAAQAGARSGVFVADMQKAGRGRGGHNWHSAWEDGLYVSALVSPALPLATALWLSLVTGLAGQAAILETTKVKVDIRWPNDLILKGRKCGGVLVETAAWPAEGEKPAMLKYAVIGVGLNLNQAEFPPELEDLATSLRMELGKMVSREKLLAAFLRALDEEIYLLMSEYRNARGAGDLLVRFTQASSWVKGKHVSVDEGGGYTGVTAGLDAAGFLRVAGDDGILRTVLSGGVRDFEAVERERRARDAAGD